MDTAQKTEFVYTWHPDREEGDIAHWCSHRILKRTKEWVFVRKTIGRWEETIKLRRRELEIEARVWWRGHARTDGQTFYSEEGKALYEMLHLSREFYAPECLKALGLKLGATAIDVKHAYHQKSLKLHPDVGGSHEAFLELQKQYQNALRFVNKTRMVQS